MSANNTPENQAIALAGIFQATSLCKNLATYGRCDEGHLAASLESILRVDADSVLDVYGGTGAIKHGLRVLRMQMASSSRERDLDLSRYAIALIQLGGNLERHQQTLDQIRVGLQHASTLDFDVTDPTMINHLADLYRNNISHLSPRIMISGEPQYLNNELTAAKIRASLLAGLRSVILWHQCGATRAGLIFNRNKYVRAAQHLMNVN